MDETVLSTTTTDHTVTFDDEVVFGGRPAGWLAYGVVTHDNGLSYQTYSTPEEATRDPLWRRGAKIVRLWIGRGDDTAAYVELEAERFPRELEEAALAKAG